MNRALKRVVTGSLAALLFVAPIATTGQAAPAQASVASTVFVSAATTKAKISTSPKSATVASGKTHGFQVKATGSKVKYQWQLKKPKTSKWVKATGSSAKASTLKVKANTALNGAQYRVVVSNSRATVTSKAAKLTVVTPPKVSTQPKSATVVAKSKVTLAVKASGGSLSYQWQHKSGSKWANISKATKASHTFTTSSGVASNAYRVVVSNKAGKIASKSAAVATVTKPKVSIPHTAATSSGKSVTLKSQVSGGSLSYQWEREVENSSGSTTWVKIPGATKKDYTFNARAKNELDTYRVTATNKAGKATSNELLLLVGSSKADPYIIDQVFSMPEWVISIISTLQRPSSSEAGKTDLYAEVLLGNMSEYVTDPADWVRIEYIGSNGQTYTNSGYTVEDDYMEIGPLPSMLDDPQGGIGYGVVFADVPASAVKGGVWRIKDHFDGSVAYVKGF